MTDQSTVLMRIVGTLVAGFLFIFVGAYFLYSWVILSPVSVIPTAATMPETPTFTQWLSGGSESAGMLGGDWGRSLVAGDRMIYDLVQERLPSTVELLGLAIIISLVWGMIIGALMAYLRIKSRFDGIIRPFVVGILAFPIFAIGLLGIYHLGFVAQVLPLGGWCEPSLTDGCAPLFERLEYVILPLISLTFVTGNGFALWMRSAILRMSSLNASDDGRSNVFGIGIIWGIFQGLPYLFAGLAMALALVETIFAIPGIGRVGINSLIQRDLNLTVAALWIVLVYSAILYIISRFINIILLEVTHLQEPQMIITPLFMIGLPAQAGQTSHPSAGQSTNTILRFMRWLGVAVAVLLLASGMSVMLSGLSINAYDISPQNRLMPPSAEFPLGTDQLGRDMLGILAQAIANTLGISGMTAIVATIVGGLIGLLLALIPDKAGLVINSIVNYGLSMIFLLPLLAFAILSLSLLTPTPMNIISVFTLMMIPLSLTIVRAGVWEYHASHQKRKQKPDTADGENDFFETEPTIAAPVSAGHLVATVLLSLVFTMLLTLNMNMIGDFLGLMIQPPAVSPGSVLSQALQYMRQAPFIVTSTIQFVVMFMLALWIFTEFLRSQTRLDS